MLKALIRWLVVAASLVAMTDLAFAQDAEEKVYKQAYGEVKESFDKTKASFDAVYGPLNKAREAVDTWRRATTTITAKDAIKQIEDLTASGVGAARDELVARLFGPEALEALQTLEKVTGKKLVPEAKGLLDMLRSPQDRANDYGYMYGLSSLERAFRDSPAADALQKTAAIFEKGEKMVGKAGEMVEFVALFDPNNYAAEGPVGRLKAVGDVIRQMESIAGEFPGMGDMITFYADATDAFAGALTRLDEQVKDARDGSICGQLGYLLTELKVLDTYMSRPG